MAPHLEEGRAVHMAEHHRHLVGVDLVDNIGLGVAERILALQVGLGKIPVEGVLFYI